MATSESVRADSAKRGIDDRQVYDWGGKRFVPPRGVTLPAVGLPGEVFTLIRNGAPDQLYIFDEDSDNWSTIGPRT